MALLIAVVAYVVYLPTLGAGWTDTDDIQLISEDAHFLMNGTVLPGAFTRPFFPVAGSSKHYYRHLVTASFMADARRAGAVEPGAFHATNVWLHVVASVLVFAIAAHLTRYVLLAEAVTLLFVVHPAAVQTVAWVPGRSDGLLAVFALASILAWLKYDRTGARVALLAHLVALAAALMCKETAIALVPLVWTYSVFVTRQPGRTRCTTAWLGWLITLGGWLALRSSQLDGLAASTSLSVVLQNTPMLLAGFGKLLMLIEPQVLATLRDCTWWPGWVAVLLLALGAVWLSSERRRLYLWAVFIVPLVILAPTLAASDVLILDNRLYLALVGIVLGVLVLAETAIKSYPKYSNLLGVSGAVAVVLLGGTTLRYSHAFDSPKAFCQAAVAGSPHLALAHVNLGSTLFREGDLDGAAQQFTQAVAIDSRWPVAHNNLGLIFMNQGQLQNAEREFTTELAVNPDYPKAHYNLGLVLARTGHEEEAMQHFERVVQLVPSDIGAWGELLKYWGPRSGQRAEQIMKTMEKLGVRFHSPQGS